MSVHMRWVFLIALIGFSSLNLRSQNTTNVYLSGTGAEDTKTWDFYCSDGRNAKQWTTIEVPSCWEQQGFGAYNYGHDKFSDRLNETGLYKKSFSVPKAWSDREIKIVFEGVMTDATVKVNGQLVGPKHQGAFTQFEYNISNFLEYGKQNELEVLVQKHSDNTSVNEAERNADFWIFGGIYRPVYLEIKLGKNIQRVAIDAKADGTFKADVYTSTRGRKALVEVEIQTLDGEKVESIEGVYDEAKYQISGSVKSPKLWNPESPSLYQAVFRLKSGNKVIHEHTEKFGFRTVEVRENDGIYVNNVRVKLKGVNRHTFHPDYGRTSSKALSIQAVKLMKEMNMNAVRMSHYPPEKHFLDACDSLGLFVLDELTGWQSPSYDKEVGLKLLQELVKRDVNHPSIIIWDNGNEGGWNYALDDEFARLDIQKRKVIHPWQDFRETNTLHYVDYDYLSLDGYSKRKIFFPTEVLHGLYDGGHGAGLEDFWFRIWNHPLAAGAFLWVFADEAVVRTDRNNELDTDGNHAPDGILGPYLQKEGSFYAIKKIWSPVYFEKRYVTSAFNGVFNIENRYHYTNLSECTFQIEWLRFPSPGAQADNEVLFSEEIKVDLAPGQKGEFNISLPENWQLSQGLSIVARDDKGEKIASWSYPVQSPEKLATQLIKKGNGSGINLTESSEDYHVEVGQLKYSFSKENGHLTSVFRGGDIIPLKNGPIFVSKEKKVDQVVAQQERNGLVRITTAYENGDTVNWEVQKNGLVTLDVSYEPANNSPYAGISFSFPEENVSGMHWMGEGPFRVWKNRMEGTDFGVWEKDYNATMTGYSDYIYPEFSGYHAGVYWVELHGKDNTGFKVYIKSNDIFLRMLTPKQPSDARTTLVNFPKGDISFLHGINPIGTKFKDAQKLGPQSSNYHFNAAKIAHRKLRLEIVFDFDDN